MLGSSPASGWTASNRPPLPCLFSRHAATGKAVPEMYMFGAHWVLLSLTSVDVCGDIHVWPICMVVLLPCA